MDSLFMKSSKFIKSKRIFWSGFILLLFMACYFSFTMCDSYFIHPFDPLPSTSVSPVHPVQVTSLFQHHFIFVRNYANCSFIRKEKLVDLNSFILRYCKFKHIFPGSSALPSLKGSIFAHNSNNTFNFILSMYSLLFWYLKQIISVTGILMILHSNKIFDSLYLCCDYFPFHLKRFNNLLSKRFTFTIFAYFFGGLVF